MTATASARAAEDAQRRADKLAAQADRMSDHASGMYGRFAGGQPLLVGHHSYRSAVRDRNRADNATRRAIETRKEAERAQVKANGLRAVAELDAVEDARSRPWCPDDFQKGDIVKVRDFRRDMAVTSVYRVKRVNGKTLTLDGGGGGWDDPKRTYDRVLARTRDGVTVTDPGAVPAEPEPAEPEPAAAVEPAEPARADAGGPAVPPPSRPRWSHHEVLALF